MTAERDRLRAQRETISKQFEELSKLRKSEAETLFEKYKEKAAVQVQGEIPPVNLHQLDLTPVQPRTTSSPT